MRHCQRFSTSPKGAAMPDKDQRSAAEPTEESSVSDEAQRGKISRRNLLKIGGVAATAGAVPAAGMLLAETEKVEAAPAAKAPQSTFGPAAVPVTLTINGQKQQLNIEPRVTLLDAMRNRLDLTGAKKVCDRGQCGACTVLVNGKPVMSCMTLAIAAQNQPIQTIEGLAKGDNLHPIQAAFIEHDALMCGFCTPGFIMSIKALLDKNPNPSLEQVKAACQGNVCRCGTYPKVFEAALSAAQKSKTA
jgi:aerobic-type carbon monoxide dehydrogenase small subunit (CoxS/CutS family)